MMRNDKADAVRCGLSSCVEDRDLKQRTEQQPETPPTLVVTDLFQLERVQTERQVEAGMSPASRIRGAAWKDTH